MLHGISDLKSKCQKNGKNGGWQYAHYYHTIFGFLFRVPGGLGL